MGFSKTKICVLFAPFVVILAACNNDSSTVTDNHSNTDTMNMTTLEKEPQLKTMVKGSAGDLFVSDGGAGGIPVVFVHSFGGNTRHWDNQLEHLRSDRRAIAFDLRGHGQSEMPANGEYDVNAMANDIAAVADSLKLNKFVLVGHSMGGSSAIAYAGKHPDRVAGLLITGTPGKTPGDQAKPIINSLESDKYPVVMEDYMKKLLENSTPATDKLEREGMNKIPKPASIDIIKSVFRYDPLPDLRNYPGPKLIVARAGEENPNSLHTYFPGIPYIPVEVTSHWIQLDKPGEFNRILDDFLATVEKRINATAGNK
jgi:pimeloyl-ACP methyl ester carboxylesterase